jgi:type I restriction-modification system DNA methylase subunit
MADNKKETERAELHRTIWGIANDLRGSVDGWDFKQYVLGMLFYRYISENLDRYISKGEIEAGNTDFSYTKLSDEEAETAKDDIVKEYLKEVNFNTPFLFGSQSGSNVVATNKRPMSVNEAGEMAKKLFK